jgi:hypothetical protein
VIESPNPIIRRNRLHSRGQTSLVIRAVGRVAPLASSSQTGALVTSSSTVKPMNLTEQLPKLKIVGDGIAKLGALLFMLGLRSGTLSELCEAIALSSSVSTDHRSLARQSGAPAFWFAGVPQLPSPF